MKSTPSRLLVCNCENTVQLDRETIERFAKQDEVTFHSRLCRGEIPAYEEGLKDGGSVCVTCTQESPLFAEIAAEAGAPPPRHVNIREMAGWTAEKRGAPAKIAALLAATAESGGSTRLRTISSDGLCLVIGSGQTAFDTAALLNRSLSVTLLLAGPADGILLPPILDFPVFSGRVSAATGSLGAFDVTVDAYAAMLPSSRRQPEFAMPRDGARSRCSVIFDMTGNAPLFARPGGRDGYFRADPADPAAVMRAVLEAGDYVGEFEKPIYVTYDPDICAHERSRITGCTKCIDTCPAGAIDPDGDNIAIDAGICGGCGNCAGHCPTGAIEYEFPARASRIDRLNSLIGTYLDAGGKAPVLLFHDATHGTPLIGAAARYGRGLPANVLAEEMHSTSGIGHDLLIAAFLAGASGISILGDPRKQSEHEALEQEIALARALLDGLGLKDLQMDVRFEHDPDALEDMLWNSRPAASPLRKPIAPLGSKRDVATAAIAALAASARSRPDDDPAARRPRHTGLSLSTPARARCAWHACLPARRMPCATIRKCRSCASSRPPASSAASAQRPAPRLRSRCSRDTISARRPCSP